MNALVVSGVVNIETTLHIDEFPITYAPVHYKPFGIRSQPGGVGYNIVKALTTLGSPVQFVSHIGNDVSGAIVKQALASLNVSTRFVQEDMEQTPQSVVIYDKEGRRQVYTDLKDVQQQTTEIHTVEQALQMCMLAVLTNVNFSRPFLEVAKQRSIPIAVDVHAISSIDDDYNSAFMNHTDILFMSHEKLPCVPEQWVHLVMERYAPEILVIGMGAEGALLAVRQDGFVGRFPVTYIQEVVSTVGAGDALFASFLHFYHTSRDPYESLKKAIVFAGHKIGEAGAANGFLTEEKLNRLYLP